MYLMTYFPFVVFLFQIKDFNLGKFIPDFVLVCASGTAPRFLYSSHCVLGVEHRCSLDCCQWVHGSSAIWATLCLKSTNFSISQSIFWLKWRNKSTGLGTWLQKGARFVCQQDLYVLKTYFFFQLVPIGWNIQIMFSVLFSFPGSKLCSVFLCYCALEHLAFHKLVLYVFMDFSSFVLESL